MNVQKKMQKALNHLNKADMRFDQLRGGDAGYTRFWYVQQINLRRLRGDLLRAARARGVTLDTEGMPK